MAVTNFLVGIRDTEWLNLLPVNIFFVISIGKWHGIVVSMMACSPEDPGSIPRLAKVHSDVIFFLGVFMIQFNLFN